MHFAQLPTCRLGQKFQELESEWLERHCLRVLPGAKDFANSTSSLFGALKETFDFQVGSPANFVADWSYIARTWTVLACLFMLIHYCMIDVSCLLQFLNSSCFNAEADSVRNQYEHFLSLWRSSCAMVADRRVGIGASVNETVLLQEAENLPS